MTPTDEVPSLLDWLKTKFAQPRIQRRVRFALASLSAVWGVYLLSVGAAKSPTGGFFFVGLAFGLVMWGLSTRGESVPMPDRPELSLARKAAGPPAPSSLTLPQATRTFTTASLLTLAPSLRLPSALALAIIGQWIITSNKDNSGWGLFFYACGLASFGWIMWKDRLLPAPRADDPAEAKPIALRTWLLGIVAVAGLIAFFTSGGNRFRAIGVVAWLVAIVAWLAAAWEGSLEAYASQLWERIQTRWGEGAINVRFTRGMLLLLAILAIGVFFRYYRLSTVPPEMTSDHVEKLLDVGDLLNGQYKIFFERNTGREPLQFYAAALVLQLFNTGLTYLTLKIVTATAGFLMLPFIYLIGRELEDENFGLLATLLAAVSYWATTVSRMGLRFPLTPLFVAPVIFFLLRGVRRGARNDFLFAGLFLGMGLYGYSTVRVLPILVLAAALWFAFWPKKDEGLAHVLGTRFLFHAAMLTLSFAGLFMAIGLLGEKYIGPGLILAVVAAASVAAWAVLQPQARDEHTQLLTHTLLLFVTMFIVFLPLARYSTQRPDLFWSRTLTRLSSEEQAIKGSPLLVFLSNNWNAALLMNYGGEHGAWANTILNIPSLDLVTGALFILGATYLVVRFITRRDKVAGFLLLSLPVLALPSTLSLAFPDENPSFVRMDGMIPVIVVIAAYPLWLLLKQFKVTLPSSVSSWASAGALAAIVGGAAYLSYDLYFNQYDEEYRLSAQNASEMGAVIHDFAHSVGSYETAFVRPFPYWVDTRAVGMYSGDFGRDFAIQGEDLGKLQDDPRPKLFILHRDDFKPRPDSEPPTLPELRRLYPTGKLSVYHSAIPYHDFLIYFVPGTVDVDENTLPTTP